MGVKLYTLDASPPVRSAMMACEAFNIPFEKIAVDLLKGEHLTPEYLKDEMVKELNCCYDTHLWKNPLHTVPMLEDGDIILHDSHAILMYLADTYGKDESWYPKDVKKRALVNQKLFFDTSVLFPRIRNVTFPLLIEGNKNVDQKRYDEIAEAYGFLEEFLSRTKFLAADHITIADVAALSSVTSLELLLPLDAKKFPRTTAWLTDLKKRPFAKKQNESGVAIFGHMIKTFLEA